MLLLASLNMSRFLFIIIVIVFLWSGTVSCWVITDINESLLDNRMKVYIDMELETNVSRSIAFIYPGTKWCGAGNIAENEDDLGFDRETDFCCRQHDNCHDVIEGGESKHNLTNTAFYTRLACDCDEQFRRCLHRANKLSANIIGVIYFDTLETKCFRKDLPVVGCAEKAGGLLHYKCVKYEYTKGKKKYQWFDVPIY